MALSDQSDLLAFSVPGKSIKIGVILEDDLPRMAILVCNVNIVYGDLKSENSQAYA
jgi:hypothetical protein